LIFFIAGICQKGGENLIIAHNHIKAKDELEKNLNKEI